MIDYSKTIDYLTEKARMSKATKSGMCGITCEECPLGSMNNGEDIVCSDFEILYPEKAIEIVQRWGNANPQRTYMTEFLKHYPNAQLNDAGTPKWVSCPHYLGLKNIDNCNNGCVKCWNQPIEESEK